MEERTRLIRQLDKARAMIRAAMVGVDTKIVIYPAWTVKHVLAHIAAWEDVSVASLRVFAKGEEPAPAALRDIEGYNAQIAATCGALSYDHVAKEWELARDQLKSVLNEMPAEKFTQRLLFPWGPIGTIGHIIGILADHEEEHAEDIQKLKARSL